MTYRNHDEIDFLNEVGLLALGSRLRRLSDRLMASGQEVYKKSGLGFEPRWFPLFHLLLAEGQEGGGKSVGECASALKLTHASVSQNARAMAKAGLVLSEKDPGDERRRILKLSEAGFELAPKMRAVWKDIESALQDISDNTGTDVLGTIGALEEAISEKELHERAFLHKSRRLLEEVTIVEFRPEFRDAFKSINMQWLEKYFVVEDVDRKILSSPETIIAEGGSILFAQIDGEIVGTCALMRCEEGWELSKMGVLEEHRGKQIGKKLMIKILQRAQEMQLESVFLMTNSTLKPAIALYKKFGFKVTQRAPHPKYDRCDLQMKLSMKGWSLPEI